MTGSGCPFTAFTLPVISVGNISMGGSGKTPFVQSLGRWLNAQGIAFDILSRGYGRISRGVLQVDPAGPCRSMETSRCCWRAP